jgi:hypothetical protein
MSIGPEAPTLQPSQNTKDNASALVSSQFVLSNTYASQSFRQVYQSIADIKDNLAAVELDVLTDWLVNAITVGGTGISATYQQDLWDTEKELREQSLADSIDKVSRVWARGAWPRGDGILGAEIKDIQKAYLNNDLDRARAIRTKLEDMEITNVHFAIQRYTELAVSHEAVTEKAYEAIAQTAAQVAAGALSAAHAQASVGFSSSYGVDNNISSSITGSYGHNTSYDADA